MIYLKINKMVIGGIFLSFLLMNSANAKLLMTEKMLSFNKTESERSRYGFAVGIVASQKSKVIRFVAHAVKQVKKFTSSDISYKLTAEHTAFLQEGLKTFSDQKQFLHFTVEFIDSETIGIKMTGAENISALRHAQFLPVAKYRVTSLDEVIAKARNSKNNVLSFVLEVKVATDDDGEKERVKNRKLGKNIEANQYGYAVSQFLNRSINEIRDDFSIMESNLLALKKSRDISPGEQKRILDKIDRDLDILVSRVGELHQDFENDIDNMDPKSDYEIAIVQGLMDKEEILEEKFLEMKEALSGREKKSKFAEAQVAIPATPPTPIAVPTSTPIAVPTSIPISVN